MNEEHENPKEPVEPVESVEPIVLEDERALLLEHEADGIKELDNNLPRWWIWLFYITIIFSAIYMMNYHVLDVGDSSAEAYVKAMVKAEEQKAAAGQKFAATMMTLSPSTDMQVLASGKETYIKLCAPCHRPDGGGLVGPNLCDDYFIHGPSFADSLRIIVDGNPVKGMIAWKSMLPPRDIYAVASYIQTLRGSNPPNPQPPENQAGAPPADEEEIEYE